MNRDLNFDEVDERLREWAYFFRDRRRLETCRSIEKRFRAVSEDFAAEGWGDMEAAPKTQPAKSYALLRALETHEAIQRLDRRYKWALTYAFCYPGMARALVLRLMRKYTGRHYTWSAYLEQVELGKFRVQAALMACPVFSSKSA